MIESQIKDSLEKLRVGIDSANADAIKENMAFLDTALAENRRSLDAQLKHYLKNRSYMKALAYLDGQADIPKGRCGGRTDFS